MAENVKKGRIAWIDVLRAFAIVLVLLSHYDGGRLSKLASICCVQMFFFISGMFAFGGRYTLTEYVKKQAKSLMLPYALFAVINIVFYRLFNPSVPAAELMQYAVGFVMARRNNVMVAAMWFLPCLFITSVLYKLLTILLKKQRYILPVCFAVSAVFKLWLEGPVYVFSINQGLKYLVYIALGGALYPYIKDLSIDKLARADIKQKIIAAALFVCSLAYVLRLYQKGYVLWPQAIWALSVVYFINVVVCIIFFTALSLLLAGVKPIVWIGRNTLGFCCMENIDRALFNTAMAMFGFGFVPNNEIKALVHTLASVCIGSVIIAVINRLCPQVLGKTKNK